MDEVCARVQRVQQGMHDSEVAKVQRQCSFDILSILGDLGWTLMDIDTLPFGIALPIHEALHLLRKDPPSGMSLFRGCCIILWFDLSCEIVSGARRAARDPRSHMHAGTYLACCLLIDRGCAV